MRSRGILHRLPVGVVRAALHVVDLLAIQFERDAQFDQRLDDALAGQDTFGGRLDLAQMAGADRGQGGALRPFDVDHAPRGEIALEGARRLLLDLGPCRIGDRGQFTMQVIHAKDFL